MAEHTRYQQKIIQRYYDSRGDIAVQRLSELVTELYLSEGKKRQQHWKNIIKHLESLGVKQPQIDHLVKEDKPELLAEFIQTLAKKS